MGFFQAACLTLTVAIFLAALIFVAVKGCEEQE